MALSSNIMANARDHKERHKRSPARDTAPVQIVPAVILLKQCDTWLTTQHHKAAYRYTSPASANSYTNIYMLN
jgi:hypothetical protein